MLFCDLLKFRALDLEFLFGIIDEGIVHDGRRGNVFGCKLHHLDERILLFFLSSEVDLELSVRDILLPVS